MKRLEELPAGLALATVVLLPLIELVLRDGFGGGLASSAPLIQHATLWVAFLGAALAAREGKLLALATGELLPAGRAREVSRAVAAVVAVAVTTLLARAGVDFVLAEREWGDTVTGDLPTWIAVAVIPFAFGAIALRLVARAGGWKARAAAAAGLVAGVALGQYPGWLEGRPAWPGLALVGLATALGAPLFAALGGAAVLLFLSDGVPIVAVPLESYRLAVSPFLPAIPLFTLTGFLLAEGRAAQRLLAVFRALFGWMPGGTALVCALLCAFLTVFTGGSGVTILALGALLYQALLADRYRERFALGLLTASGSLGLLLPPALPLILYGIVAQVPIEELFIGGILPGVLLIGLIAAWGVREGIVHRVPRTRFDARAVAPALWGAKYELALPLIVLVVFLGGWATLVESASIAAVYALVVQVLVHRDLRPRDVPRVAVECLVLLGGVLIILAVAMGLTSWLVDAQVPERLLDGVQSSIGSRFAFLLCLNVFLLAVGCLMDVFSATVVVVPLIVPLGAAFGIDPIHLGIIFVANLELGYLTPPVGLNLFLASYRFEKPLLTVYRAALPMLVILGIGVLLVTYVPALTTALLDR